MARTGTCESCGAPDEVLHKVQRYYVTPDTADQPGSAQAADIEWWCFACRSHYPHEVLEDE